MPIVKEDEYHPALEIYIKDITNRGTCKNMNNFAENCTRYNYKKS